jgi:aspartyl-tRNA(Asn)/glutamyl-tRNA(Gln) amidotransferase subunit B
VDLNRAGVPLIEIVTHPDLRSPDEAADYMNALKNIVRYVDVSDADMEKGEFRCDINLSVRPKGSSALGVKTEIKNLNSFKFAAGAIRYEFERQVKAISQGEKIVQETRLYDAETGVTKGMRTKEGVSDYRYFPEPDLPPLRISREWVEEVRATLPELPSAKRERFMSEYALSEYDARVLAAEKDLADYFEEAARGLPPKTAANWVINQVVRVMNDRKLRTGQVKAPAAELVALVKSVESDRISATSAKEALETMILTGKTAEAVIAEGGMQQVSDAAEIEKVVEEVIRENPKAVADYKGGKETAEKFFIGQVMKRTRGRANFRIVTDLLKRKL